MSAPPLGRLVALASLALVGCAGAQKVTRPPGEPPTPQSVTARNPGGDAFDPELAALERLQQSPWGARGDLWKTVRAPMPDWRNWSTASVFGFRPRAMFRYGEDNYAGVAVSYKAAEGKDDPESCLKKAIDANLPAAQAFGVRPRFGEVERATYLFQGVEAPVAFQRVDGSIENMFASDDYVGAVVALQSWPGTCLVYAFAVKSTHHPKVAREVRDRWVADGAPKFRWEPKLKAAPELEPPDPAPAKKEPKKAEKQEPRKVDPAKKGKRPPPAKPKKQKRPLKPAPAPAPVVEEAPKAPKPESKPEPKATESAIL